MTKEPLIQDIPIIKKPLQDLENLKTLLNYFPQFDPILKAQGIDIDQTEISMKELATIPDRFNDLFAKDGWIYYESMDIEVAKAAIRKAESGNRDDAEANLVNYYNSDIIMQNLRDLKRLESFSARWLSARKALIDYNEGRYHACVPVVLALLDGMVTEAHLKGRGSRKGFFAEDADLEAWNSISGHNKGLKALAGIFNKGRYKTTTGQIEKPYRNGIMHGLDLGYDNKMVAAKAWAALFSVRDWVEKAEKGLLDPQPPKKIITGGELAQQVCKKKVENEWRPRDIKLGINVPVTGIPEDYGRETPERKLVMFFSYWNAPKPNYRAMADCVVLNSSDNPREMPRRIREIYDSKHLKSFEFTEIKDTASATTMIQAKLDYEEHGERIEKLAQFAMNNMNPKGKPEVRGTEGSNWFIRFWELV